MLLRCLTLNLIQLDKIGNVWSQDVRLADLIEDFRELQSIEALRDNAQGIACRCIPSWSPFLKDLTLGHFPQRDVNTRVPFEP